MQFEYAPGATPIDPDEALGLIPKHISTQADLNAWEEMNIVEGADWIARQKIIQDLNEGLVRELHSRMFNQTWQWAGTFRKSAKSIGIDWTQIAVALKNLLDNTAYQIENKAMPIDEIVVRFDSCVSKWQWSSCTINGRCFDCQPWRQKILLGWQYFNRHPRHYTSKPPTSPTCRR